ncbi:hypothetical protein [Candidatus Protochlamydia phocaeensis]|uniref:hypothetical protein n=1 Tax=Candidatus Protochlamydia phocaeensis TaxID=1414722 RepID=UPI0008388FBA|nr:hypothetical protein [Candidatus Protochlamydia phocaeensis]
MSYIHSLVLPLSERRSGDFEVARRARSHSQSLQYWGNFCQLIGGMGAVIGGCGIGKRVFAARAVPPSYIWFGITSLALGCLGMFLKRLSSRAVTGLTDAQVRRLSIEKIKQFLTTLPISAQEWEEARERNRSFSPAQILRMTEQFESMDPRLCIKYAVEPGNQPRFRLSSAFISLEQKLELLDLAYRRGIILEFSNHGFGLSSEAPTIQADCRSQLSSSEKEKRRQTMERAFLCSLHFLERRLRDPSREFERINAQLDALCFEAGLGFGKKVLKPVMTLENNQTLVIQDNCYKGVNVPLALEKLTSSLQEIKVEINSAATLSQEDLQRYREELIHQYPHKLAFIEHSREKTDIWQDQPYRWGFREIFRSFQRQVRGV